MKGLITTICAFFAVVLPAFADSLTGRVVVSATASDNVGVVSVQLQVDGNDLGPAFTAPPYSITWDTATISDGPHIVSAIARDAAGNQTTQFLEVTVDNTPPTISLIAPTAGSVVSG